jgi:hypothetical protein
MIGGLHDKVYLCDRSQRLFYSALLHQKCVLLTLLLWTYEQKCLKSKSSHSPRTKFICSVLYVFHVKVSICMILHIEEYVSLSLPIPALPKCKMVCDCGTQLQTHLSYVYSTKCIL